MLERKKKRILSRICCADTNFYAGFVLLSLSLEVFKTPVDVAHGHVGIWLMVNTAVLS